MHFHDSRTPQSLKNQWNLLKELKLLKNQVNEDEDELEISFNELEDRLDDKIIMEKVELNTQKEDIGKQS